MYAYPLHGCSSRDACVPDFRVMFHDDVVIVKRPSDYTELPRHEFCRICVLTAAAEVKKRGQKEECSNSARFILYLLDVAGMQGCTDLVLSAWGCGAFRKNAEIVAAHFKLALQRVRNSSLQEVFFAVIDDHNSSLRVTTTCSAKSSRITAGYCVIIKQL